MERMGTLIMHTCFIDPREFCEECHREESEHGGGCQCDECVNERALDLDADCWIENGDE
jgi:hypothetical protein